MLLLGWALKSISQHTVIMNSERFIALYHHFFLFTLPIHPGGGISDRIKSIAANTLLLLSFLPCASPHLLDDAVFFYCRCVPFPNRLCCKRMVPPLIRCPYWRIARFSAFLSLSVMSSFSAALRSGWCNALNKTPPVVHCMLGPSSSIKYHARWLRTVR